MRAMDLRLKNDYTKGGLWRNLSPVHVPSHSEDSEEIAERDRNKRSKLGQKMNI